MTRLQYVQMTLVNYRSQESIQLSSTVSPCPGGHHREINRMLTALKRVVNEKRGRQLIGDNGTDVVKTLSYPN